MKSWEKLEPDVYQIMNKNYTAGRQGRKITHVVVHHNAGNLTIPGIWQVWQTRPASAHYQVTSSGQIGQLVHDRDTAWHSGNWDANLSSIGIEHANSSGPMSPLTAKCLEEGAHLLAAICVFYKLGRPKWWTNVFPHGHYSIGNQCPGHLYPGRGSQNVTYITRAQHWYDVMTGKKQSPQPTPEKTKETAVGGTEPTIEELFEMNSGIFCVDGKVYRYLLFNTLSGWEQEYSNGTGGAMGGDYNNPLATTLRTGSFAKVTRSHYYAIKRSLADLRANKVELSGTVTITENE